MCSMRPLKGMVLTFFLSACPFFRSLFAMITPVRRVSNTGSLRFAAASGNGKRKKMLLRRPQGLGGKRDLLRERRD